MTIDWAVNFEYPSSSGRRLRKQGAIRSLPNIRGLVVDLQNDIDPGRE